MSVALRDTTSARLPEPTIRKEVTRVAYILSLFPCYDETFILREIKALTERGVSLQIFSLRRRKDQVTQEDARAFVPRTRYAAFLFSLDVIAATVRTLTTQPAQVAALLGMVVRGTIRKPIQLAKSLVLFPKIFLFAEAAKKQGIEHLHAHWATYPATAAMAMSRLTGISWSFTCHAHDIFLTPMLLEEKLEDTSFVLTCTADNKRHLESLSDTAEAKVRVSYHGLDLSLFEPSPERDGSGPLQLLGVGSLLPCKGFEYLIEASRILRERGVDFRVTIAGGGPEEGNLRSAARQAGLDDIISFTGYVTQKDLVPLYRGADVFALPAVLEIHWGIPNVLIESLACAVPVVTTGLPSLPELVEDGVHGLVARNKDATDLADKIEALASDPELRRSMGMLGRSRVMERFDIDRTIQTVVDPMVSRGRRG